MLFKDDHDPADDLAGPLESLVAAGAGVVVLAAATGSDGYDSRPVLDDAQWATLFANLDRLAAIVADRGLLAVLHPHVGTIVETRADVDRVLAGSSIPLCLDTGHLLIGGTDPLELAKAVPNRIAHTHLKDVDAALAAKVQSGELTYTEAVKAGMYTPLGTGDVDIAGIVSVLRDNGFDGWFVLEQDTILDGEPDRRRPGARRAGQRRATSPSRHDAARSEAGSRMTLRIGVLGASRIAESAIVGPAAELGHRLVAVAARDRSRAEVFAEKYGVERVVASYQDVIDDRGGRRRLQPAGQLAARTVEPRRHRRGQAGAERKALRP